jgi:hypothetical protein
LEGVEVFSASKEEINEHLAHVKLYFCQSRMSMNKLNRLVYSFAVPSGGETTYNIATEEMTSLHRDKYKCEKSSRSVSIGQGEIVSSSSEARFTNFQELFLTRILSVILNRLRINS